MEIAVEGGRVRRGSRVRVDVVLVDEEVELLVA
jgi:hypothetical protein